MKTYRGLGTVPANFGPAAVTIGKFDGVHLGHRAVIAKLREVAAERSLAAVAVTFDRNPIELFAPEQAPANLVSLNQKLAVLATTGLDATVVLTFDHALAGMSADDFAAMVLTGVLHAKVVLVGRDFRYGSRGAGTVDTLTEAGRELGFEVVVIDDVDASAEAPGGRLSSTGIRSLIAEGRVREASALLGRAPEVSGLVVHGAARGRELGFPTANLSPECDGMIPGDGIYAGYLHDAGVQYQAAISVGNNPTFEGVPQQQVEAHVLDHTIDLYDRRVTVTFVEKVRGMVAFESVPKLIEQIADDVVAVRRVLEADLK
ncbi:MAG TPA: bifunctional riboflavin kinase/FAD synthetase [Candidatus Lumbricidophila sp.]|nr:bifunctional riboflavin kinase/FAD synthetase [Candidatus Lumbricidophila sp.]